MHELQPSDLPVDQRTPGKVTSLLRAANGGDAAAREQLWSILYDELRRVAHAERCRGWGQDGLQTTALVHEAYLRLCGDGVNGDGRASAPNWANRRHFYAAAAEAMRFIRVDDVRKRCRLKRGGGHAPAPVSDDLPMALPDADAAELLALDDALHALERTFPRAAEIVKLRYFVGLTVDETAALLDVSPRTVDLDWQTARGWLHSAIDGADGSVSPNA